MFKKFIVCKFHWQSCQWNGFNDEVNLHIIHYLLQTQCVIVFPHILNNYPCIVKLKYLLQVIVGVLDMNFNLLFGLMNDFGTSVHLYHHVVKVLHQIQVPHAIFCLCKIVKYCEIFLDKRNVFLQDSCFVKFFLPKTEQFWSYSVHGCDKQQKYRRIYFLGTSPKGWLTYSNTSFYNETCLTKPMV